MIETFDGIKPRIAASAFVHPLALVRGDVEIGELSVVHAGAVINADLAQIRIGDRVMIEDNCVIHAGGYEDWRRGIRTPMTIGDDVILGHGYESHSGFRDAFVRTFGAPPGKSQGAGRLDVAWIESPLGPLVAGATEEGICLLEFTDRRMLEAQFRTLRRLFKRAVVPGSNVHLRKLQEELTAYFSGALETFSVPLVYPGTTFQRRIWEELLAIPYGETRTYEEMAAAAGSPGACRAAGTANGMNRIAILIPCHRVVNKDGKLGGYGGGLWRKQRLLDLERGGSGPP